MTIRPFSCFLIGDESLLVQCGEALLEAGHTIRGVISDEHHVRRWAKDRALQVIEPDAALAGSLSGEQFDYLFSIANLRMLPEHLTRLPLHGAINFHDGPLPQYAGMHTPAWALLEGARDYGVTWHWMTTKPDTGGILRQERFPISREETSLTLNSRCFEAGLRTFTALIDDLAEGRVSETPQDLGQRTYYRASRRPAAAAVLDLRRPADELARIVRALSFGPYKNPLALPKLWAPGHDPVALHGCDLSNARAEAAPGTLIGINGQSLRFATGAGEIEFSKLTTLEGAPLSAAEAAARLGLSEGVALPPLPATLASVLTETAERAARAKHYWLRRLATYSPLDLPYIDRGKPAEGPLARVPVPVSGEILGRIGELAGCSPPEALQAVLVAFACRLAGVTEVHLGWRRASLRAELDGASPLFSSCVPVQLPVAPDTTAIAAARATVEEFRATAAHFTFACDLPARYPKLASLRGTPEGARYGIIVDETGAEPPEGASLTLACAAGATPELVFDTARMSLATATRLARQLGAFAESVATNPHTAVGDLPLLDDADRNRMLVEWNATETPYDRERRIHELIEEQSRLRPGAVAVACDGQALTFAELNSRANRLARTLVGMGVGPDVLVGIFAERSVEMMVGLLAVHKAGGAYVPLDPSYPRDRIAYMLEDSAAPVVLTQRRLENSLPAHSAAVVLLDDDHASSTLPGGDLGLRLSSANLAYVIYTSGSTGKPKGVMVEHRNVVNFFAGMDQRIGGANPGTWLAVTSLSFDISVLELLWTLSRGFKVVIANGESQGLVAANAPTRPEIAFSLFFFSSDQGDGGPKAYDLLLRAARFADERGFEAVWTPERHFHAFGGLYPNPSVTSAALAMTTSRVRLRTGSCVLPLHSPIRVAEEWAVVDNLSQGRVDISFASGWQPHDFVLAPENFSQAKQVMLQGIEQVKRLWRGEAVPFPGHDGVDVQVRTLPRPVQPELNTWITAAGNPETFRIAGERGYNLLTHLLGQSVEEVGANIRIYREAWEAAGHPGKGQVTLMLHTFVGRDSDVVRETVRRPMVEYLRSSMNLVKDVAWSFPAFKKRPENDAEAVELLASLSDEESEAILQHAFERYYETSGLFGTPEHCLSMVAKIRAIGVDEVACLVDFGVETETAMAGLELLDEVRRRAEAASTNGPTDYSVPALIAEHRVTHLQCTPSMATMLLADDRARMALPSLDRLLIGGEAFPGPLAEQLEALVPGGVINMYGPTETTIWSSTHPATGEAATVPIGTPIANTQMYVLDAALQPAPVGVAGELYIGGDGVVRGYLGRADLTAERFLPNPFLEGGRMYRTGDLARFRDDGVIEFLGRIDHQVKIRGFRIELGEIESQLGRLPGVREAVVIAREDEPGDKRLVGYVVPSPGAEPSAQAVRARLAETLPDYMVPSNIVFLAEFPHTPNNKIDRKALPAPGTEVPLQVTAPPQAVATEAPAPAPVVDDGVAEVITTIWREVLRVASVGPDDNFFDLGGNSLLVVQIHRKLVAALGKQLTITDLFRFPTVRQLAAFLSEDEATEAGQQAGASRASARLAAMSRRGAAGVR